MRRILRGKLQLNESQPEISISKEGRTGFELELSPRDQVEEMVGDINKIPSPNTGLDISSNELRATGTKIDKKGLLVGLKIKSHS